MKIAVIGTGAMGSVYAGLLAAAGNEVWAIDIRRDHIEAIRAHGLRVEGASGDRTVPLPASTEAADAGRCELVIIATKAYDLGEAALSARPLLGPDTVVVTIQNGLGNGETARGVLGEAVTVGVAGGFGARIVAPGHTHHEGWELIRLGELDGPVTARLERVAEVWRDAGFGVRTFDDIHQLIWEKLICNGTFNAVCALTGLDVGGLIDDGEAWAVAASGAGEAFDVARARGITLDFDDPVDYVRTFASKLRKARPSTMQDLQAGRRTEIDVINGGIARAGREAGVPTPTHDMLTSLVKAAEKGRGAVRA
jgi:2-dehydropantoate 2-reductase